jgi:hypothetical protein
MADVEITTSTLTPYQYTITYILYVNGTALSTVTIVREEDNVSLAARILDEVPNMTWFDSPAAGTPTYEIRITVAGTNIASAQALTRALNAIIFG